MVKFDINCFHESSKGERLDILHVSGTLISYKNLQKTEHEPRSN